MCRRTGIAWRTGTRRRSWGCTARLAFSCKHPLSSGSSACLSEFFYVSSMMASTLFRVCFKYSYLLIIGWDHTPWYFIIYLLGPICIQGTTCSSWMDRGSCGAAGQSALRSSEKKKQVWILYTQPTAKGILWSITSNPLPWDHLGLNHFEIALKTLCQALLFSPAGASWLAQFTSQVQATSQEVELECMNTSFSTARRQSKQFGRLTHGLLDKHKQASKHDTEIEMLLFQNIPNENPPKISLNYPN